MVLFAEGVVAQLAMAIYIALLAVAQALRDAAVIKPYKASHGAHTPRLFWGGFATLPQNSTTTKTQLTKALSFNWNFTMDEENPIAFEPLYSNFVLMFVPVFLFSSLVLNGFTAITKFTEKLSLENMAPNTFMLFSIASLFITCVISIRTSGDIDLSNRWVRYLAVHPMNLAIGLGSVASAIALAHGSSHILFGVSKLGLGLIVGAIYVLTVTAIFCYVARELICPATRFGSNQIFIGVSTFFIIIVVTIIEVAYYASRL